MRKCSSCDYVGDNFSPQTRICRPCKASRKRESDRIKREIRDAGKDFTRRCKLCGKSGNIFEDSRLTCRTCRSRYNKDNSRTKIGHIKKIYNNQKGSSKKRGHPAPDYSLEQITEWIMNQEMFHNLYEDWVASGYDKWTAPSLDRINNNIGYSFDNIKVMTFKQNSDLAHEHCKEGKLNTGNKRKEVYQYTLDGVFIKAYPTMRQADVAVGGNARKEIKACCDSGTGHARGFRWRYANQDKVDIILCSIDECINGVASKGYCGKHYMRFKRSQGTP
jgi:hypothetical protein